MSDIVNTRDDVEMEEFEEMSESDENDEFYDVEAVLDKRIYRKKVSFLSD